jgi:hypothetical protein
MRCLLSSLSTCLLHAVSAHPEWIPQGYLPAPQHDVVIIRFHPSIASTAKAAAVEATAAAPLLLNRWAETAAGCFNRVLYTRLYARTAANLQTESTAVASAVTAAFWRAAEDVLGALAGTGYVPSALPSCVRSLATN